MDKAQLYDALVRLCQDFGITTEATYEHLHSAIDSIMADPPA
jgi:predicted DNA binding protein